MEDVMLAIQAKATTSFVTPPAQDVSATQFLMSGFLCLVVGTRFREWDAV